MLAALQRTARARRAHPLVLRALPAAGLACSAPHHPLRVRAPPDSRTCLCLTRAAPGPQAFNPETGGPARCVEMASWPKLDSVSETFGATLRRALVEAFWATSTSEGMSVLFDRCGRQRLRWGPLSRALALVSPAPGRPASALGAVNARARPSVLQRAGSAHRLLIPSGGAGRAG